MLIPEKVERVGIAKKDYLESNKTYRGLTITDTDTWMRSSAVENVLIEDCHFRNVKFGLLGYKGGRSKNVIMRNCTIEGGPDFDGGCLIYGNGWMDRVEIDSCGSDKAKHLILTGECEGWYVHDCKEVYRSTDTSFYLQGAGHLVEDNHAYNSGKCGFKIRGDAIPTGYCLFRRNYGVNYGLVKDDAGGIFNIAGACVRVEDNIAVMTRRGLVGTPACFRVYSPGCTIKSNTANILCHPDFDGALFFHLKNAANDAVFIDNRERYI